MGGVNPYIEKVKVPRVLRRFTITIIQEETGESKSMEVNPNQIPYGRTGLPGSILDLSYGLGVEINHACGGVCACATCHVHVRQGLESCSQATDDEQDQLDEARELTLESRLSCQCVPNGDQDIVVVIPAWNNNLVKEGH